MCLVKLCWRALKLVNEFLFQFIFEEVCSRAAEAFEETWQLLSENDSRYESVNSFLYSAGFIS